MTPLFWIVAAIVLLMLLGIGFLLFRSLRERKDWNEELPDFELLEDAPAESDEALPDLDLPEVSEFGDVSHISLGDPEASELLPSAPTEPSSEDAPPPKRRTLRSRRSASK